MYNNRSHTFSGRFILEAEEEIMFFFFDEHKDKMNAALQIPDIKHIAEMEEFYFQKAKDKFDEYMKMDTSSININELVAMTKNKPFSFEGWLNSYDTDSTEYRILLLIGQTISYFDANAAMKKQLNEYSDKRVISKSNVRQNNWIEWLLKYKQGADIYTFPESIRNTILYIENPERNVTISSENWRKDVINALFEHGDGDLFEEMSKTGITAKNPLNNGILYGWILCSDFISPLWKTTSDKVPSSKSQNFDNEFHKWLSSQTSQRGGIYTPSAVYSYSKALREEIGQLKGFEIILPSKNVFNCTNLDEFNKLNDFVRNHNDFEKFNENTRNRAPSAALGAYERFLSSRDGARLDSAHTNSLPPTRQSNATFLQWFEPVITALKELGGSATPKQVREHIASTLNVSDEALVETRGKTQHKKFDNEVAWARNYLAYEGFIDKNKRGVWTLTKKGYSVVMTREFASEIFRKWVNILKERRETSLGGDESESESDYEQIIIDNIENVDEYSREIFFKEVFFDEDRYDDIIAILTRKKNIILQGAPGVGKSYMAKRLAYSIIEAKDESKIEMIQFHQNYSYEDFIEGFRPNIDKDGKFDLVDGVFKKFCQKASYDLDNDYFFIIDEINRGNLSKVMGELMLLLENDKRGKEFSMKLTYSGKPFYVPENVYIIGMMNTADRSLAMIDYALRRRFSFVPIEPVFDNEQFVATFKSNYPDAERIVAKIIELNAHISKNLDSGHQIGHSYFCSDKPLSQDDIDGIIKYEIIELLKEYFFDDEEALNKAKGFLQ